MSRLGCLAIAALWVLVSGAARPVFAQPSPQERSDQSSSEQEVWAALEKFDGEEAFQRYLRAAHNQSSVRSFSAHQRGSSFESYALTPTPAPEFPPALPASGPTLEATRSATAAATADEGDIVQQIGRFLIVLKDGRLFSIDTRPDGHPGLRLVDRANVYRTNGRASYTTMLASANRLVVKGVNEDLGENEIAVFALNESGALMYEGAAYYRGAGDRAWLADDKLVLYSDAPLLEWGVGPLGWPWRVSRSPRNRGQSGPGTALLDARNVYAPLQHTNYPVLHTIAVCPLSLLVSNAELDCRSTGVVGTGEGVVHLSPTHLYLWLAPDLAAWPPGLAASECTEASLAGFADTRPNALFQIPLDGQAPRVVMTRGRLPNRNSLDVSYGEVRALLYWESTKCRRTPDQDVSVKYFSMPVWEFRSEPATPSAQHYVDIDVQRPTLDFANRFANNHLVYLGRSDGRIAWIPVMAPRASAVTAEPLQLARIVPAGANVVATGRRGERGIHLSFLDLSGAPRVTDAKVVQGPFEYDGSLLDWENWQHRNRRFVASAEGSLLGIPTIAGAGENEDPDLRRAPGVVFVSLGATGHISPLGALMSSDRSRVHWRYRCKVGCTDWSRYARAIFMDDRAFAWAGAELIEGEIAGGAIREIRRVNLTAPVQTPTDRAPSGAQNRRR